MYESREPDGPVHEKTHGRLSLSRIGQVHVGHGRKATGGRLWPLVGIGVACALVIAIGSGRWLVRPPSQPAGASASAQAEGMLPGGVPSAIQGEAVLAGMASLAALDRATDAETFLVVGWYDSQFLQNCGGGTVDPSPLAATCSATSIEGAPLGLVVTDATVLPDVDGPLVLRVHTNDSAATDCLPENIERCRQAIVVDDVAWAGDNGAAGSPLRATSTLRRLSGLTIYRAITETDGTVNTLAQDLYWVAIKCGDGWPDLTFSLHGDPRLGMLALFRSPTEREVFAKTVKPDGAASCLPIPYPRPGSAMWVSHENALVLSFGEPRFADALRSVLDGKDPGVIEFPDGAYSRDVETLADYLTARAAGELDHAFGWRLAPGGWEESEWYRDTLQRFDSNALFGTISSAPMDVTAESVGSSVLDVINAQGGVDPKLYSVDYATATADELASERFVTIKTPLSGLHEWAIVQAKSVP